MILSANEKIFFDMGESDNLSNSVEDNNNLILQSDVDDHNKLSKQSFEHDLGANNIAFPQHVQVFVPETQLPIGCSDIEFRKLHKSSSVDSNATANSSSKCDEELTSLALGTVIELDEKLEQYFQESIYADDFEKESASAIEDSFKQQESLFTSGTSTTSESSESEDDELVDSIDVDDWRKEPGIGAIYQVDCIPPQRKQAPDYDINCDELIWDPSEIEQDRVENYLKSLHSPNSNPNPSSLIGDNEDALMVLIQCNHNVLEATRRYRFRPPPLASELSVWSAAECRQFEHGLTLYGKDFHTIHRNKVKTRSVGEIVKFYYLWKKSEMGKSQVKSRLGKKKEAAQDTSCVEPSLDEAGQSSSATSNPPHLIGNKLDTRNASRNTDQDKILHPSSNYDPTEYMDEDDLLHDFDVLDRIPPISAENHDNTIAEFADFDPPIFVAYSDPCNLAPVAATFVHHPVKFVSVDESISEIPDLAASNIRKSSLSLSSDSTLPPNVQSSNVYYGSTSADNWQLNAESSIDVIDSCGEMTSPLPSPRNIQDENTSPTSSGKHENLKDHTINRRLSNTHSSVAHIQSNLDQRPVSEIKQKNTNLEKNLTSNTVLEATNVPC